MLPFGRDGRGIALVLRQDFFRVSEVGRGGQIRQMDGLCFATALSRWRLHNRQFRSVPAPAQALMTASPGDVRISASSGARAILPAWTLTRSPRRTRLSALPFTTTTNAEKAQMRTPALHAINVLANGE